MAQNGQANDAAPNHIGGPRASALPTNGTAAANCTEVSHQFVTKLVEVDYDSTAKCPTFNRFVDDIFCSDRDLIRWVRRALGDAITRSVDEQLLFIAYSTSANGKSTLFELINKLLGDHSRTTDFGIFLSSQKSDVRMMEAVGELKGTRLALAFESNGLSSQRQVS